MRVAGANAGSGKPLQPTASTRGASIIHVLYLTAFLLFVVVRSGRSEANLYRKATPPLSIADFVVDGVDQWRLDVELELHARGCIEL